MFPFNLFRPRTRPYAKRLPGGLARTATLTVRIQKEMLDDMRNAARLRSMSTSEFTYQILKEHLQRKNRK